MTTSRSPILSLIRRAAVALTVLAGALGPATAQVSIDISRPGVSIGINLPVYPAFVRVPNHPVYYAPRLQTNLFFYDGLYWVYESDDWYASSWYNGPWHSVAPQAVPLFVLRIPVRYYRNPPAYFQGWRRDGPPRWGDHWGPDWSRQRSGWDRWDRRAAPPPAPLPTYQRRYPGDRYPSVEQQSGLHSRNYRYRPRDDALRHPARPPVATVPPPPPRRARQVTDPRDRAPPPARGQQGDRGDRGDQSDRGDRGNGKARGSDRDRGSPGDADPHGGKRN